MGACWRLTARPVLCTIWLFYVSLLRFMAREQLEHRRYWIALNAIPNLTPEKFTLLLDHFPSPEAIWEAPSEQLKAVPGFERSVETFVAHRRKLALEQELTEIERLGLDVLTVADAGYPDALRAIAHPPPVLLVKGDLVEKDRVAIAIVGTRKPSDYGRMIAEKFSKELAERGFTIVSGMALGVDTAAHQGALNAGARTLAVLGGGFGHVYPQQNVPLVDEIAASGAVLTEFSPSTKPDRWTFPQRNRIISGLTRGTLVVEAGDRSGALITAKSATQQGREVFAVPGPITKASSRGAHRLIQQGAKLVVDVGDVLEEFPDLQETLGSGSKRASRQDVELSPVEAKVFGALDYEPIHFDDLVERTDASTTEVSLALFQLDAKGLIKELSGKRYAKLP